MPVYEYRAKDGPGRTVAGEITAESRDVAVTRIDGMGLSPVSVREKREHGRRRRPFFRHVREADVTVFTRQLASLVRAGVPILRGLRTIRDQCASEALRRVVQSLESRVRDGAMLSEAMGDHADAFSSLYVSMVRAGEEGGVLDQVLLRVADAREEEEELRRRVQAALAYPVLVLATGAVTVFILITYFMPRVIGLFEGQRGLPLPTRILIEATHAMETGWYWVVLVVLLCAAVAHRVGANERGRLLLDRLRLALPVVGPLAKNANLSRFARTLSLLLEVGVAIDRALELSADTLRNTAMRAEVLRIRESTVRDGEPLSGGFRRSSLFPPFLTNMAAVGEEGGSLDEVLAEAASFYEKQVRQQTRLATSLLEPVLILAVGTVVGFIVTAMLLPIFELGTSVR